MTSSTFSALGSLTFLSTAISPDAENDIRRKITMTERKSMKLTRLRLAFGLRCPCPWTLFHTYRSFTWCIRRAPGAWITWACGLWWALGLYLSIVGLAPKVLEIAGEV